MPEICPGRRACDRSPAILEDRFGESNCALFVANAPLQNARRSDTKRRERGFVFAEALC